MPSYTTLVSDVQEWAEDDSEEHVAALERIIQLGEMRMFRAAPELPCYKVETPLTGVLVVGNPLITLGSTPRRIRSLTVTSSNTEYFLRKRTESWVKQYWRNPSQTTAIPKYYAIIRPNKLRLAGTPSTALTYSLYYSAPLAALSSGNLTNWLTDNAYDLLLKCCLAESASFLRMDKALAKFEGQIASTVAKFEEERGWNKFNEYNAGEE